MRGRKRRNDIPTDEFENVVSLYKNKISLKQIALDYDVTAYVVRDVLVGMGVEIGPRGRPWKQGVVHKDKDGLSYSYVDAGPVIDAAIANSKKFQDNNEVDLFDLGDFRRPLGE